MQQEQHDDSAPGGGELLAIGCDPKCQLDARAIDGEFVLFMERNLRCEGAFSAADVKPAWGGRVIAHYLFGACLQRGKEM